MKTLIRLAGVFLFVTLSVSLPQSASASATNYGRINTVSIYDAYCLGFGWNYSIEVPAGNMWGELSITNVRTGSHNSTPYFLLQNGTFTGGFPLSVSDLVQGDDVQMRLVVPSYGDQTGSLSEITIDCSTGAVLSSAFLQDYPVSAADLAEGPSIPAGYVLRTITCDVAVFNMPGGTPVGDNRIKANQTWFVNPKSVKAPDGEAWTAIFVSGWQDGYIPTRCVG